MNYQSVANLIGVSLQNLSIFDTDLLDRKVREECVNHRLAFYIESIYQIIVQDDLFYSVDLEYNKNISNDDKAIEDINGEKIPIRPDIIVHQRSDNQNNLIAIEAKHASNTKHDIHKLKKLLEMPYCYSYSIGVSYYPRKDYFGVRIFWKNGEVHDEKLKVPKIHRGQVEMSLVNHSSYIATNLLNI